MTFSDAPRRPTSVEALLALDAAREIAVGDRLRGLLDVTERSKSDPDDEVAEQPSRTSSAAPTPRSTEISLCNVEFIGPSGIATTATPGTRS
jgi:hypothetical protein